MNVRQGFGQLMLRNGTLFKGNFDKNQPTGQMTIFYGDGSTYVGKVERGVVQGFGELKSSDGFIYLGLFDNGQKEG